ncbi:LrgB family protein [Lysinibacillus pakistanensis]|uniref:LrgB family protein n=1 Tax=Lysinibacillus pakistanensis TaxID=759811 RepID=A0AAX3X0K7_9BACI|nr:LrgB family protein [Lysinibacillus pakistanensis]MDM5232058.1 LrgB family protein [Lysinibacillus pakistanensis]QGG50239.1 LrgB family protein [Lysinibacillus pakistanensis]WHY47583.1 LrgB family protein [Lysinibacillus pakistanensis]WHY52593.1 LrgB family protein [Lysinibacillus pakistanensis]
MIDIIVVIGTIVLFMLFTKLYQRFPHPIMIPLVTTTIVSAVILVVFQIPYSTYMQGGEWLQKMLGPAVVALAYPLYNQRAIIMKYKYSILSGIFIGMITGLVTIFVMLKWIRVSDNWMLTALPKSLTTPVGMQVSETIGGIPPLTAVFVMLAGFVGAIIGPLVIKFGKIDSAVSRGVAVGSASHGVGLVKLREYGERELSVGSLSMGLTAIIGAFLCPLFVYLFM